MAGPIIKFNHRRVLSHAGFWIAYLAINTFIYGYPEGNYKLQLSLFLLYMPATMLATYFTTYLLIPYFLLRKKLTLFFLLTLVSSFLFGMLQQLNVVYLVVPKYMPEYTGRYTLISFGITYRIVAIYTTVAIAASIKLLKYWYRTEYLKQQVEKEKLRAELAYLKAQIHPHFLFNTLNNLYALTLKNDSRAPEIVLKLSELLDYILYECGTPVISLKKEIALMENYIELEKLRYGTRLNIDFRVDGKDDRIEIAPLLLLPLVENAFKHGTSHDPKDPWMRIRLDIDENRIEFLVENGKSGNGKGENGQHQGIGLENVQRRLELLYPKKHDFELSDLDESFSVKVSIIFDQTEKDGI
ncbi:MAG: histidine kinase [Candidatus Krumholzibacteriota bacterium]|nr:histidine kinase [Candidatus Krumholzibacteriota bacterium]